MVKKYTEEFRRIAVKTVSEDNLTVTEAARKLGVNYKTLREWCRQEKFDLNLDAFISLYKRHLKKKSIVNFRDYLMLLEDSSISHTTPCNGSSYTKYFEFASKSKLTVLDDCLSLIRKSAEAGYFVAGDTDCAISLYGGDREDWLVSYEEAYKKGEFYLIDEDSPDSGVYKIISQKEFIAFYSFDLENCQFEGKHLEDWDSWDDFHEDIACIEDKFKVVFLQDVNAILPDFMVVVCSDSAYALHDGGFRNYYLIFGYNPKTKHGEGLFIEDVCCL